MLANGKTGLCYLNTAITLFNRTCSLSRNPAFGELLVSSCPDENSVELVLSLELL